MDGMAISWRGHRHPRGRSHASVHQRRLLPRLVEWIGAQRVSRERIAIVIAGATHRAPRADEYARVLGEAVWPAWRDRGVPHLDEEGLAPLGTMPAGGPRALNRPGAQ